jgi:sugar phosphate isomerase/epimerase
LGVLVECFGLGLRGGIERAAQLGLGCVQVSVGSGEAAPDNLSAAQRKDLLAFVKDHGMVISSLCGDIGGHGLMRAEENDYRYEVHKKQADLAAELECSVITTHIGIIPPEPAHPRYDVLLEACSRIGAYALNNGVRFAIETGPEPSTVLLGFLERIPDGSVGVNMDPANLAMITGDDPVAAVHRLKGRIVHTHVKDGKLLAYFGAERVYTAFAEGGITDERMKHCFLETPLGQGSVDFAAYFTALRDIGYDGWNAIEREVGDDPARDIELAMEYLRGIELG